MDKNIVYVFILGALLGFFAGFIVGDSFGKHQISTATDSLMVKRDTFPNQFFTGKSTQILQLPKAKSYHYLKSTIRLMERQEELSKQDLLFVLNNMVLEIERLEKTKQEKK